MRAMPATRGRQRGVAVITALLMTTLAVTIVASLFWQQQVQVRSMENQRLHLQTKWILLGALDYTRLLLREDGRTSQTYTSLTGVWNTPLAETRLDDFVERERVQGENFEATLSGRVIDATSRYNLNNLTTGPVIQLDQVTIFKRLLVNLNLDPALAQRTAEAIRDSMPPLPTALPGAPGTPPPAPQPQPAAPVQRTRMPLALTQVDDLLSVKGFTPEMVAKLREFVVFLPGTAVVNVNTAPAEVISALVPNYSMAQAQALVQRRKQAYYRQPSDFTTALQGHPPPQPALFDVKSEYFLVRSRIRLDRAALDSEALINRQMTFPNFNTTTVWVRQN